MFGNISYDSTSDFDIQPKIIHSFIHSLIHSLKVKKADDIEMAEQKMEPSDETDRKHSKMAVMWHTFSQLDNVMFLFSVVVSGVSLMCLTGKHFLLTSQQGMGL